MRIVVVWFRAMVSGFPDMRLKCSARFLGEGGSVLDDFAAPANGTRNDNIAGLRTRSGAGSL
jgi:hypothetical protein